MNKKADSIIHNMTEGPLAKHMVLGNSIGVLTTPLLTYLYFLSGAWKKRKAALQ